MTIKEYFKIVFRIFMSSYKLGELSHSPCATQQCPVSEFLYIMNKLHMFILIQMHDSHTTSSNLYIYSRNIKN